MEHALIYIHLMC